MKKTSHAPGRRDVFISYSRQDKEFVQTLNAALEASSHEAWIDWKDIPPSADWWQEIEAGIEEAHTFIFVISGASVASRVCRQEIDHADQHNKRIIPVVRRSDFSRENLHSAIAHLHWLYFREDDPFENAFNRLVETIDTDLDYTRTHTQLLVRALEWEHQHRYPDLLLRGHMLEDAERWLIQASTGKKPKPTELQSDYIVSSRRGAQSRQRTVISVLGSLLFLALGAGGVAFWQFQAARAALVKEAEARELAETERSAAESARRAESEQRRIAQEKQEEAEVALQQAEAAEKAEAEQRQTAQRAQRRAEAGELRAQRQAKIAEQQTELAEKNAADAKAATTRAEEEAERAEQEAERADQEAASAKRQALNAEVQADALGIESLISSGLNFQALLSGLNVANRIRTLDAATAEGTLLATTAQRFPIPVSQHNPLRPGIRLQAVSALREVIYAQGWGEKNTFRGHTDSVGNLSFSPDGRMIASAADDYTVRLWDTAGQLLRTFEGHQDRVNGVAVSPDSQLIASAASDRTVRLWSLDGRSRVFEGHTSWVEGLSFSPDGRHLVSGGGDRIICVWDLQANTSPILQEQGQLAVGGPTLEEGNFFKEHTFQGQANQSVAIRLQSSDFDTYLGLLNEQGELIAENDDDGSSRNSFLEVVLPSTETYRVIATSYRADEVGRYTLSVAPNALKRRIQGHTSAIYDLEFSPDGRYFASASSDGTARLWNLQGEQLRVFEGHIAALDSVSFSPSGETLATTSDDDSVRLWSLAPAAQMTGHLLQAEGYLWSETPDDQGRFLAEHSFHGEADQAVLIRLESNEFDPLLRLVDEDGEVIAQSDDRFGHNAGLVLRLPRTGLYRVIATSYNSDAEGEYSLSVLDRGAIPGAVLYGHSADVRGVKFSPDGQSIVTSSNDGTLQVWNLRGQNIQVLRGHRNFVNSVDISPDGKLIVSAGGERVLKLWKQGDQTLQTLRGHVGSVESVRFSPDGQLIASAGLDDTIRLWDLNGQPLEILEGHRSIVYDISFSRDGQLIASASGDTTIRLWTREGTYLRTLEGHIGNVNAVAFSPDGRTLVSASDDGSVRIWDVETGSLSKTLDGHSDLVLGISFAPNGSVIISASEDGTLKMWDATSGELLKTLDSHSGDANGVSFSPSGHHFISVSDDGTVKLWDLAGNELKTFEGHTGGTWSAQFSPDGRVIASTSADGTIKLWDLSGQELQTLDNHEGTVWDVHFSPDGKMLASAGTDGNVILWNFDLNDLIIRGCSWLHDYMSNPATPADETGLCSEDPSRGNTPSLAQRLNWIANVWGFWRNREGG